MNYLHCSLLSLEYRETRTETAFKTSHLKQSDIYQIEKKILSKIRKINTHASDIRDMLFMPLLKLCTFYILHWLLNFARFFLFKIIKISCFHDNTDSKFFLYKKKSFFFVWNLRKHFISQSLLCFTHRLKYLKKKEKMYIR